MRRLTWKTQRGKLLILAYFMMSTILFLSWSTVNGDSGGKGDNMEKQGSQIYFYEMDKKQQGTFFKKLKLVKIGDSVQKVKTILGEPTYDQTGFSKEKGEFRARVLEYYVKILKKGSVNEKYDRSVSLIFDAQNRLIKIESNIEEHQISK